LLLQLCLPKGIDKVTKQFGPSFLLLKWRGLVGEPPVSNHDLMAMIHQTALSFQRERNQTCLTFNELFLKIMNQLLQGMME